MMKCASNGIPNLIQELEFNYSWYCFKATFFNGLTLYFDADVCADIDLMQTKPSRMQMLQAENTIEKTVLPIWGKLNLKNTVIS